jgi:hypothetical protein
MHVPFLMLVAWRMNHDKIVYLYLFYCHFRVDGFALPQGHTHESLGLSNEKK